MNIACGPLLLLPLFLPLRRLAWLLQFFGLHLHALASFVQALSDKAVREVLVDGPRNAVKWLFETGGRKHEFPKRIVSGSLHKSRGLAVTIQRAILRQTLLFMMMLLGWASTAQAVIPASERAALISFYISTNAGSATSWLSESNWNGAVGTECTWQGVRCDDTQSHVTGLFAGSAHLTGTLPSLSALTALQDFEVGVNQLTGPLPSLSGLTALTNFQVGTNEFTGSLPSLSGLTSLEEFSVGGNQLSGWLPPLGELSALQHFYADYNQLTGPIPSFSGVISLKSFLVSNNNLSGPIPAPPSSLNASDLCGNSLVSSGDAAIDAAWVATQELYYVSPRGDWLACQIDAVELPTCTLTAASLSVAADNSTTLTVSCIPAATSYEWTGGNCPGTTGATCTVTPAATTTYTARGINPSGTGVAVSIIITVSSIAPSAPTDITAVAGNGQATTRFAAPASDGGSPITGYSVTSHPSSGVDSNAGSVALIHLVTGLSNGTSYTFTVTASNAVGVSAASRPSNSVTPTAGVSAPVWNVISSLQTARSLHTATLLPNGKVLVSGGWASNPGGGEVLRSAELYDPASDAWSAAGLLAAGRYSHTATLLPNGKVLVAGGYAYPGYLASNELYDPASNSWSAAGALQTGRYSHSATLLPNGKVLVAGGDGSGDNLAELYDPASDAWSSAGALTSARERHTATLLPNGKVMVAGGNRVAASAELYDPTSDAWSVAGALAAERHSHTATLLADGKVLVAGGYGSEGDFSSTELYDPASNSWSSAGSLITARYSHTATLLPNGKVLVAGGDGRGGNLAELYDPITSAWSAEGPLHTGRLLHTATLLPNGKVLVAGGGSSGGGGSLASAELYDPGTQVDNLPPTCTLTANPASIAAGGTSLLTAICTPVAASYSWSGATCLGSSTDNALSYSCGVAPLITTTYTVAGINSAGTGFPARVVVTVAGIAPSAPTNIRATAGVGSMTIAFTPGSIGSGTLVNYAVTCSGSSAFDTRPVPPQVTGISSPITVYTASLFEGPPYSCRVQTVSTIGVSNWSAGSNLVTPPTVPPTCTLTATPASIVQGSTALLTANCSPAATSYLWSSNTGFGSTVAIGTVSPSATTTYTVTGSNPAGLGNTASTNVYLGVASQSIIFGAAPTVRVHGAGTVSATASSGLAVSLTSLTPSTCTVTGTTVAGVAVGTCSVAANQTGNANYLAAIQVSQSINVVQGTLSLNLSPGWNLVGNSVEAPIFVANVFSDQSKILSVWKWVTTGTTSGISYPTWAYYSPAQIGGGSTYATSKGYDLLAVINAGEGFWVNANAALAVALSSDAAVQSPTFMPALTSPVSAGGTHALAHGWSLIATGDSPTTAQFDAAIATSLATPPAAGSNSVPTNLTSLWAFDSTQQKWYFWAPSLVNSGEMANYLTSKSYLDFAAMPSSPTGTLSPTTGFWVNMP